MKAANKVFRDDGKKDVSLLSEESQKQLCVNGFYTYKVLSELWRRLMSWTV